VLPQTGGLRVNWADILSVGCDDGVDPIGRDFDPEHSSDHDLLLLMATQWAAARRYVVSSTATPTPPTSSADRPA
jgi:hypothetical protein